TAGEIGGGVAVGFRDFAEIIHRSKPAAAAHILNRYRWIPGNMSRKMSGKNSAFDIRRAAGGEIYDEVQSFALIKGRPLRREAFASCYRDRTATNDPSQPAQAVCYHSVLLPSGLIKGRKSCETRARNRPFPSTLLSEPL